MGKKELAIIELTKAQAEKYSAQRIKTELVPRLSNRRCKAFLVLKVSTGVIQVPAGSIGAWTYKAVEVKGEDVGDVAGKKSSVRTFTKPEYEKLDAKAVAALIQEHTTEKKASYIIQGLLVGEKMSAVPRDLVFLSNGRITVEGVTIESTRQGLDISALVSGVTISQPVAEDAAA